MARVVGNPALAVFVVLIALSAAWPDQTTQQTGNSANVSGSFVSLPTSELYSDPYQRYFSGHWCDCWRKANAFPIDEKAMFEGILPRTDTPVWQKHKVFDMTGMTADERLLCRTVTGLVNRVKAMWYCTEPDDFWYKGSRQFFKDGITGRPIIAIWKGPVYGPQGIGYTVRRAGSENFMVGVKRWIMELDPPSIDGCIIYDPALLDPNARPKQPRDMLNVIRVMCAIERAIPLTPALYKDLMKIMPDKSRLPIVANTMASDQFNIDKFHGEEKAAAYALYAWAFNNFWSNPRNPRRQCLHHALCYMPPVGPPNEAEQPLTDYIVQWGIFTFYSYGADNIDEKHIEYVLTQSPMNIPVVGQLTAKTGAEGAAERSRVLRLFSRFGKYFVDANSADNLTMHSGQRDKQRVPLKQKPAPPVTLDPTKNYVAFCLTSNNSLGHFTTTRAVHWDVASRGRIPLGWAVPLAAADLAPNIAKFYYNEAKPTDCFVADQGGLGLALPTVWGAGSNQPDNLLTGYLQRTQEYLGYLDISTLWLGWLDQKRLDSLTRNAPGVRAVFYGASGANRTLDRASFVQGNLPVFFTYTDLVTNAAELEKLPTALAQSKERFFFIGVDETAFRPEDDVVAAIAAVAKKLGDKFVVVRPDQLAPLFADAVKGGIVPAEPPKWTPSDPALAETQDLVVKQVADGTIRVDGNTAEWAKISPTRILVSRDRRMTTDATKMADSEIAAEIMAAFDSRFLYVLARVRDNEILVDDINLTAGDYVALNLDTRRAPFRDAEPTEGFYSLALVPAAGLVKAPRLVLRYPTYDVGLVSLNRNGIAEELSSIASPEGYLIEAAVPLLNFPQCQWKADQPVALGFEVHDLDSQTARAFISQSDLSDRSDPPGSSDPSDSGEGR
ncbi:hypothetical protein FJY63_03890 [Candidatus Sumerlaeota bacterium]|nr:hypothetical protein [Candidatus Sumerlaeota bacterium]